MSIITPRPKLAAAKAKPDNTQFSFTGPKRQIRLTVAVFSSKVVFNAIKTHKNAAEG